MVRPAISLIVFLTIPIFADNHQCPDDRPHPRGHSACDSCPWEETLAKYQDGELSTTRKSEVFSHSIRVSVICDAGRPVDVDDVFEKLDETDRFVSNLFESTIRRRDGSNKILEILVGICDYGDGTDDCNMYPVCREGKVGWDCNGITTGKAFSNSRGKATHAAFVPWLAEGDFWWVTGNRYANLQHEYAHLLGYTYFRVNNQSGTDIEWWVEGMPQFVQWRILDDPISWQRGNDNATMLDVFTHRHNTSNYYDGLRVIAYLDDLAPWLLQGVATEIRSGIYRNANTHLVWHNLLGYIASRNDFYYARYVDSTSTRQQARANEPTLPGPIDGTYLIEE